MEPEIFETVSDPTVDKSLKEAMARGQSFELVVNSEGWAYIRSFIENSIQSFANKAIRDGFVDFNEYQLERGKVLGLNSLLADIDNDLRILNEQRQKPSKPTKN